ncbi:interleukin-6 receptor subunit beta isoform X2 [Scophthalmus maximus]|uniref:interleukin-6 receptor subunit beta isoform X2 n=1 Tax=Scophthalmus maximus TaxID=52904 RepID=UPI001FA88A36|nr:interleukin-6 receptor subunit beta isoform X2 [Scophthalmus maximus]
METLKHWSSLHGYIVFMLLTTVGTGSACEAPSSPECFRESDDGSVYTCEWSTNNTADSNVTFDLFFNETKFGGIKTTRHHIIEELLIRYRAVYIWVEAHVGNSSCTSPRRSVELEHIENNLTLMWKNPGKHPALAEVWFRRDGPATESWEKRLTNTTVLTAHSSRKILTSMCPTLKEEVTSEYQAAVVNLLKRSAYQVQIRHRSTQVKTPLWSKWSPVVVVPAELEHEPEVTMTTKHLKGFREVTLSWKPMPRAAAAAAAGVNYTVADTQSSHGCPCARRTIDINTNKYTINVTYSAVNISVIARNAAGCSPSAVIQVPAEPMANLETCDKPLVDKLNRKTCKQWYERQEETSKPENIITLASKKKQERKTERKRGVALLKEYVGYLYFEHVCDGGNPRTVKACLYYIREGEPRAAPEDFTAPSKTHSSVTLSWKAIASVDRRGVLTHYRLCTVKLGSQDEQRECHNVSASLTKLHLEKLTPGAKYNISLAAVTRVGTGPAATVIVSTLQAKTVNAWLSFGLLFVFFLGSTMCTVVLKRIKNRIFPPVPTPVIPDFSSNQPEHQGMLEGKEELHDELMLLQLHPEGKSVPEDTEESTALREAWDAGSDTDVKKTERGDSRSSGGSGDDSPDSAGQAPRSSREGKTTDLDQVDNELAMLIYRNGLVFDVKTDSP